MTQPENHPALLFGLLVADISRISAVSAASVVNIAYDFELKIGLGRGCLDIRRFSLVVPEEYFGQRNTSEVNIVRTKEPSRFWMLQSHNHGPSNDVFVFFILPGSEESDGELVTARAGIDFVKSRKLLRQHPTIYHFSHHRLISRVLFLDFIFWTRVGNQNFSVRDM